MTYNNGEQVCLVVFKTIDEEEEKGLFFFRGIISEKGKKDSAGFALAWNLQETRRLTEDGSRPTDVEINHSSVQAYLNKVGATSAPLQSPTRLNVGSLPCV